MKYKRQSHLIFLDLKELLKANNVSAKSKQNSLEPKQPLLAILEIFIIYVNHMLKGSNLASHIYCKWKLVYSLKLPSNLKLERNSHCLSLEDQQILSAILDLSIIYKNKMLKGLFEWRTTDENETWHWKRGC